MKIYILSVIILLLSVQSSNAQNHETIIGKWQSVHGTGQIQIIKRGDQYFGKLVYLSEPNDNTGKPKVDSKNPDEKFQHRALLGIEMLKDFKLKDSNTFIGGKIYDPKSGNTYNGQMNLIDHDKLNIRAFFGISILGKTETWTRVKNP